MNLTPALTFMFLLCAQTAAANNTGIFGKSGRDAETGTCTQCHLGDNGAAPTITVTGLEGPFTAGGFADFAITVKSNDPSGGFADAACPERCAGVNAAIDPGTGSFVVPDQSPLQTNPALDEISHLAKSPFVGGEVTYRVALAGLTEGVHTLYVAGNDVDGQVFSGDRTSTIAVPFTVGAGTTRAIEEPTGCGHTSEAPLVATGLLALALRRGARRRWRVQGVPE